MTSIHSNEITDVKIENQNDISKSEVIPTNNDQKPNTSTIAKVNEEPVLTDLTVHHKALHLLCNQQCIVNALMVGDFGNLEIQEVLENNTYGVTLLPSRAEHHFDKLVSLLSNVEWAEYPKHKSNNLICGQKMNEDWVRGYIVSQLPYLKMAVIDEAIVTTINNITTCDKTISDICTFGALCKVIDDQYKFEEGDVYEFRVTNRRCNTEQSEYDVLIITDNKVKAIIKPWSPTREQLGVSCAEVNNGTEVIVTGYRNHIHLFVRPVSTAGLEHYNHVMQSVAKCAKQSSFLKGPPAIGDMVLAESADKNYYRAFVTRVENDRITILYLDLGRKEVTDMKKLKLLPNNLKELPYCMTKLILRDVPRDIPLIKEIDDYLAHLVATEVPLLCTYNGIPSIDGVYLKFPDGETVNKMICKFLKSKGPAE